MPERLTLPIHGPEHVRGGPDPIPPQGTAIYAIEVFENYVPVTVGDDKFNWQIPEDLDGAVLTKVEGYVNTTGSSNVEVMVSKVPDAGSPVNMLTDKVIIAAGELNSFEPPGQVGTVDLSESEVVWGDHLRIDVDAAGGGTALGLGIILYFTPAWTRDLTLTANQGPPGGITDWEGQWSGSGTYSESQAVSNGGSSYVALVDNPTTEPGVDPGWETEWMLLAGGEQLKTSSIQAILSGNGYPIALGTKCAVHVPFDCTITKLTVLADQSGSIVVDIWKDTYGAFPPTDADSITGGNEPTLSGAIKTQDTSLTGWTTSLAEDDTLIFKVDSISAITFVTIALSVERM